MTTAELMLLVEPPRPAGRRTHVGGVGTLGPSGTSSEQAARYVWTHFAGHQAGDPQIVLYDTYELAAGAVRTGLVGHLVVANAYAGISEFYMDTSLRLAGAFIQDTPRYGIAKAHDHTPPDQPVVATHPAPLPLVSQLLPETFGTPDTMLVTSTSAAARAASTRSADLALTTEPAAALYDLEFVSPTRTIRMLWSVFTAPAQAG